MDALESADPPSPLDRRDPQDLAPRTGALTVALAVLGPLVTWCVVTGLVALFASPEVGPGRCEGIGFGCTLAPATRWCGPA